MSHLYRILLLTTLPLVALPACGTAVDDDYDLEFRTSVDPPTSAGDEWGGPTLDECVLINEPPSGGGADDGDITDPDVQAPTSGGGGSSSGGGTGCTDPAGCIDPPPPQTWPDDGGGVIVVPPSCPEWQQNPTVVAETQERAEYLCETQYGSLCDSVCECHGGDPTMDTNGGPVACVSQFDPSGDPVPSGTWHCGCECTLPSS